MAKLARDGSRTPEIRHLAVELTTRGFWSGQGLKQKDFKGEARRLNDFVRDQIRYVKDIEDAETLTEPVTLLKIGAGDCDDKATLLASLLLAIGHTPRFKAIGFAPGEYAHVWVQDQIDGVWLDLETTEPIPFGVSVPQNDVRATLTQGI